jgi:hypothetical protein
MVFRTDDPGRNEQLAYVPLRVLGGVEQQTMHGRRQAQAADFARVGQAALIYRAELVERAVDLIPKRGDEVSHTDFAWLGLTGKSGTLRVRQRLAARVREQPVDHARQVTEMEADRRDACGAVPQTIIRQCRERGINLLARLQQGVRNGLQQCGHTLDRAAQPDFRASCHRASQMIE